MQGFDKRALLVPLALTSLTAISGPLGDTLGNLGLSALLNNATTTVTTGLGSAVEGLAGDSLADADVLSPANGSGTLDADAFSSQTLLGLRPVGSSDDFGAAPTALPADLSSLAQPLSASLQGLAGQDGAVTAVVTGLGDGLQQAVTPVTDSLSGLESATSTIDAANLSVGSLDLGSNSENTVLDVDVLNTDSGSQGDIGLALISDGASGTGDVAGVSVIGGDGSGTGGLAGASVIGGDASGQGDLIGAAVIGGDNSGTGDLAGAGVLTGDNSGSSELIGAGIISGDNSGTGELAGAAVLSGDNSGTSDLIGAGVLSGDGSGQGELVDAGVLGSGSSADNGLISANVIMGNGGSAGNGGGDAANNPGVDDGGDDTALALEGFIFNQTDSARYAMNCAGPDSDGDGVCDQDDRCPNTPKGAAVLTSGCHLAGQAPLILRGVRFAYDSAQLTRASAPELYHAIRVLKQNPHLSVEVAGHTDDRGSDEYNYRLSAARAQAVHRVLVANGIDSRRLQVRGYGRSQPVAPNFTNGTIDLAGMAQNRRVEFRVVSEQLSRAD